MKTFNEASGNSATRSSTGFSLIHEPFSMNFGFYSEAEIEQLSVKEITNVNTFDSEDKPINNGLYDLCLGPTDRRQGNCPTCGLRSEQCPGHLGHIKLIVPVYNPIVFPTMFKLLGLKCYSCHKFRLPSIRTRQYKVKLMLLQANLIQEAEKLDLEIIR